MQNDKIVYIIKCQQKSAYKNGSLQSRLINILISLMIKVSQNPHKTPNKTPNKRWSQSFKSVKSISKAKSSIQQKIGELQAHFADFSSDIKTQNLKHVLGILSDDWQPQEIPCRQEEIKIIKSFIADAIHMTYSPELLYIAGVPGIGKTLCVKHTIRKIQNSPEYNPQKVKFIYVNAMKIKQPQDVFRAILSKLADMPVKIDSSKACYVLNDYFEKGIAAKDIKIPQSVTKILVIDQMDYLRTSEQQVIYTIVEWIRNKKSHLAIIGISNTIDLPQSFSLKIASRFGNRRSIFPQYRIDQIQIILHLRLELCQGVFHQEAIQYICRKIGGQQTDIRKCLHIMRESISKYLGKDRFKNKSSKVTVCNIPQWTVKEVVRDLYYDSFVDSYPDFPLAYKVVLVCMAAYFRQEKQSMAYSHLEHMLGNSIIHSVNQLRSILYDLKDLGLISIKFMVLRHDGRLFRDFKLPKNVEEEFITLLVDVDKIMIAYDADERENSKSAFNPMDRWRNHFTINRY